MPTLRERKKERTRAAIAAAALALFAERGYETVKLSDVAGAAEVGERTVFRYFGDKQELVFADDDAIRDALTAALAARPAAEPPAAALLEALVTLAALWEGRRDEGRARQAVIESSPALRARERTKLATYERALAAGLGERGVGRDEAAVLARVGVACQHEATLAWLRDGTPGPERRCRDAFAGLAARLAAIS